MISDLSSFVEFFAAVYVTMAVNNDFCSNFWTPQYYKEMEILLSKYHFSWSSSMSNELNETIKQNYTKVQKNARLKGTILLVLCILLLISMGFENECNFNKITFHTPILYCILFTSIVLIFSKFLVKNWRHVLGVIAIYGIIFIITKFIHWEYFNQNKVIEWMFDYRKYLLILIIVLPIFHQMYIYWIYSSIYKGYLKHRTNEENKKYVSSMEGIKNRQKNKVDKIYLDKWTDSKFNQPSSDITITDFNDVLFNQLLKSATPTQFDLLKSWIKFKIDKLYRNTSRNSGETDNNIQQQTQSPLSKYKKQDYSNEYKDYSTWKKKQPTTKRNLKTFCNEKNIIYEDMLHWIKSKKNNNR